MPGGSMTIRQLLRPILDGRNIRRPVRFVRLARTERPTKIAQALMLRSLWMTRALPADTLRSQAHKLLTTGKSRVARLRLSPNLQYEVAQTHAPRRDYRVLSSAFERNARRH